MRVQRPRYPLPIYALGLCNGPYCRMDSTHERAIRTKHAYPPAFSIYGPGPAAVLKIKNSPDLRWSGFSFPLFLFCRILLVLRLDDVADVRRRFPLVRANQPVHKSGFCAAHNPPPAARLFARAKRVAAIKAGSAQCVLGKIPRKAAPVAVIAIART